MPALFFILGSLMVFMFLFLLGNTTIGAARPILTTAYFGLFLYCMYEAIQMWRVPRKKLSNNELQQRYSKTIRGVPNRDSSEEYADRLDKVLRRG